MQSEDIVKVENLSRGNGFIIRWSLTYICNYNCDFCIQGNKEKHIEKAKNESIEKRRKICDNLINFIETKINKKYDYINLNLVGGEITILPDFLEIIEKIINCKFEGRIVINITTNFSTKKEVLKKLVEIISKKTKYIRDLRIKASYYKEFVKEEEFIEKVKILNQNKEITRIARQKLLYKTLKKILKKYQKSKVIASIDNKIGKVYVGIGYPISSDADYEEYLKFKKRNKDVTEDIHFIIIKGYKTSISEKLKKRIVKEKKQDKNIKVTFKNNEVFYCQNSNKISLKLDNEQSFNSYGYLCDVGMHNITISNIGDVSRCVSCKEKTVIGNMLDGKFELPTEKLICPSIKCNCSYYGIIEKGETL